MAYQNYFDDEDPPQSRVSSPRKRSNKKPLPDFDRSIPLDRDDPYSEPADESFPRQREGQESDLVLRIKQFPTCVPPFSAITLIGNFQESGLDFLLAVAFFKELLRGHYRHGRYIPSEFSTRDLEKLVNMILTDGITELAEREEKQWELREAYANIVGHINQITLHAGKNDVACSREEIFRQIAPGRWKDAIIIFRPWDEDDIICSVPGFFQEQLTLDEQLAQLESFNATDFVFKNRDIIRLRGGFRNDGTRWANYDYKPRDHWAKVGKKLAKYPKAPTADQRSDTAVVSNYGVDIQEPENDRADGRGKRREVRSPETPRHRTIPAIGKLDLSSPSNSGQSSVANMSASVEIQNADHPDSGSQNWTVHSPSPPPNANHGSSRPSSIFVQQLSRVLRSKTGPPLPARQKHANLANQDRIIPETFVIHEEENESNTATDDEIMEVLDYGGGAFVEAAAAPMAASSILTGIQPTRRADGVQLESSPGPFPSPGPFGCSDDSVD